MGVTLTERARDALFGSLTAARRIDPEAYLRVEAHEGGIRAVFASGPDPGDRLVDVDGIMIAFDPAIEGTIDAGDHHELRVIAP
jgi:hypothetical protein